MGKDERTWLRLWSVLLGLLVALGILGGFVGPLAPQSVATAPEPTVLGPNSARAHDPAFAAWAVDSLAYAQKHMECCVDTIRVSGRVDVDVTVEVVVSGPY